ncbi:RNA-guided endonuclease InsQ/TnpB family protein [Mycobacterium avium]
MPDEWREPVYRIDTAPANTVFQQNRYYMTKRRIAEGQDFTPPGAPIRFAHEVAWWVWLCQHEGLRRIDPATLKWATEALAAAAAEYRASHGRAPASITALSAAAVVRQAMMQFEKRNGRLPSPGVRRNLTGLVEHLHLYLSVRTTDTDWWAYDLWDLHADPRIPQREHEPCHEQPVRIGAINPGWLREGVRFWLRTALDAELLRWSSAVERARDMARYFGVFVSERGFTDPVLSDDPALLRLTFTAFTEYLHSPAAAATPDKPLTASAIDATQSQTQVFYTFMVDHAAEAAAATGDPRWMNLTAAHTRLWGPAFRTRRANRTRELTWYSTGDLQQMLAYLDVLAADRSALVAVTHPDGKVSLIKGLGDPQAARVWLLQALTGRRASEILMLDYDPLQPIPGAERPTDSDDPDAFVAKLRYQQTKVDGVVPTILVEQAVVNVMGCVKTIQVKRQGRRWMLVLSCDDVPSDPLPTTGRQAGIDVGIASFATTSDGEHIDNPRWGRNAGDRLAAAQQRLQRAKRRSKNRERKRETVAARHRKIANQRKDFHHKQARTLVARYDLLAVEGLTITNMLRRAKPVPDPDNPGQYLANGAAAKSGLSRSISDAGWGRFVSILRAKAEEAGRIWIEVDPRHTSDGCEKCGYAAAENRVTQADFVCQRCSHRAHADEMAARNILRAGLALHAQAA